ncbi:hypothetical protein [Streptomyces olivochromogenes]|uniref:Uncharacterized protein n=1 Tax=Streptomyces olivochromogenes TaxID=1963 RepID=A0A286PGR2_STROL|nr:hypothetical protein [Streptomyces olivochromogenes]GAX58741.1 hypothetical protein SO3561_10316 [Streptomyces olivochromogenes]
MSTLANIDFRVPDSEIIDLKALKRGMFGRARLPLLRKRLLLTAASRRPQTATVVAAS